VPGRRDRLNSAVIALCQGLPGLIALVIQHPDPHIRRQALHDLSRVLESMVTFVELGAKNPVADRLGTIIEKINNFDRMEDAKKAASTMKDKIIVEVTGPIWRKQPRRSALWVAGERHQQVNDVFEAQGLDRVEVDTLYRRLKKLRPRILSTS
jgi:hypothetical protein